MQPKSLIMINCRVLDTATLLKSNIVEEDRAGSKLLKCTHIMVSVPLSCLKVTNDLAYYAMAIWTSAVTIFKVKRTNILAYYNGDKVSTNRF
jgi:hypothetical protein